MKIVSPQSYTDICHSTSEYRDFDLLIACKNIQNSRLLKAIFFLNKDIRLFFATNWLFSQDVSVVESLDDGAVLLQHDVSLDLERGAQLSCGHAEVAGDHCELLDPLRV